MLGHAVINQPYNFMFKTILMLPQLWLRVHACMHTCWQWTQFRFLQPWNLPFLQVNNNGDISFTRAVSTYTPQAFPLSGNLQLIAPYWADVDTRGTGSVWYRQTTDSQLLARTRDEIRAAFINQATFNPTSLFIATWDHVGYYNRRTDKVGLLISSYLC